ncbi:MAG: glycosyltransferase family 2 protein [Magnetococcus sp. YQC-5]
MSSLPKNLHHEPELSIVVPVFNEESCLEHLYQRLLAVMTTHGIDFEIILVDDGSSDRSLEVIRTLANQDDRVRFASFSRNFGHEAASSCGFGMVRGRAAVLIDADLQDPPEVIIEMLKKWKNGFQVVYGRRSHREGESWFKKTTSSLFYKIIGIFSDVPIPADTGDFRLVDRVVVHHFNRLPEKNRFVRGMFAWLGFRQSPVDYVRPPRFKGTTKYNPLKLVQLSLDALLGFSTAPLRIATVFGLIITVVSFLAALAVIAHRLFFDLNIPGYTLLTAGIFLLSGIQLLFIGVLGEYIGKIYHQVQGRPLYIVQETGDASSKPHDIPK